MKWQDRRRSDNVNRGGRAPVAIGGGIGGVILLLLYMLMGGDPGDLNQPRKQEPNRTDYQQQAGARGELEDFMAVILADTEDVWHDKFAENDMTYREPKMTLYDQTTQSGCGIAQSNMGPFYCPRDEVIYMDVSFYNELKDTFGAGGDFAFAYVLAHEVGHHVQKQLGILEQTEKLRQRLPEKEYNKYSVAQELQADYFGGLFAFYVEEKGYLDPGDIEEAMRAAAAIGDDRIQQMSGRDVNVDTFTHGSSADRKRAFELGYENHDLQHSMIFFDEIK